MPIILFIVLDPSIEWNLVMLLVGLINIVLFIALDLIIDLGCYG